MIKLSDNDLKKYNGGAVTIGVMAGIALLGTAVGGVHASYEKGRDSGYEETDHEIVLDDD